MITEGNDSKYFVIPQRYILGFMCFLAVFNSYTMRVILSVAITVMVVPHVPKVSLDDTCPIGNSTIKSSQIKNTMNLYHWEESTQGLILSAFFWGYVATHIPGAILADRYGGKYTLSLGILSTSIFTILTPLAVTYGNWQGLFVLRILEGLGEGTTFPALNLLLAKWVPLGERSKLGTLVFAGSILGTVIGNTGSAALIVSTGEWSSVFYVFGALGVLWFIFFTILCYSSPDSHPYISEKEREYLTKELANVSKEKKDIPWRHILTSAPMWALVIAQIGHDWGFFAMVTDLPKYMKDVLKFNLKESGVWSSVPYILMWVSAMSFGVLCDWVIRKKYLGITFVRKLFTCIAAVLPGIFILLASYSGCNRNLAVICFVLAMGFMGAFYCGMKVNALDLAPNFAAIIMAIENGIGAISGIIVPYLIGALTPDQTVTQWRLVFWITLVVLVVTNLVYWYWGTGETQWWNDPESTKKKPQIELTQEKIWPSVEKV